MIKVETLRVFVAVAEAGNIADAGDRLGRTGSAVSMALKRLEDELGGALFESDRKTRLTPLGAFTLETARAQIRQHDAAVARLLAFSGADTGRLGIAAVPSLVTTLLPKILPQFMAARPEVALELFDQDSAGVVKSLEAGRVELGFAGIPPVPGGLRARVLFSDRFKLVCGEDHPLARKARPVGWGQIAAEELIVNGASEIIDHQDYRALSLAARKTVHNVTSLFALVKAGVGVTLLPALATADAPAGIVALDLADAPPPRAVALLSRRDVTPSPMAAAFCNCLLSALPQFTRAMPGVDLP